jgi:hypothetical protein
MKAGKSISVFRIVVVVCWSLLAAAAATAGEESNGKSEAADNSTNDSRPGKEHSGAEHEDVLDRLFSPLDNAVSDINRDLNKGDSSSGNSSSSE